MLEVRVIGIKVLNMLQDVNDSRGLVDTYATGCFSRFFLDSARPCPIMKNYRFLLRRRGSVWVWTSPFALLFLVGRDL